MEHALGSVPAVDMRQHLRDLQTAATTCSESAVADHRGELGIVHQVDDDLSEWLTLITGPEVAQLRAARRELALAEFCAASGLYRQAFASLRLFLELSFAAVHFSVHEFERRRWNSDKSDFSWSKALDEESGLLSKQFVDEFAPQCRDDASSFAGDAARTYRYCSQFVHGKAKFSNELPEALEYSSEAVSNWCEHAASAGTAVLFLLYVRYGEDLDAHAHTRLSEVLINRFGHLNSIRKFLGLAND
ncbi:hypothetical protein SOM11_07180 [Frigoribacterium sp. CFBP9039]|uniref:hypothetical protein n=1 Tax=Frigoribacterium sp. CFBP9029 TaxID=3096541 RepID=UPI002A69CC4C|nr:hypothetical protein [Frigoribacterium sp. CFBP9039]MDY0945769.1 hypothetical protein [Frigoribacterium sp. CFBP9039]